LNGSHKNPLYATGIIRSYTDEPMTKRKPSKVPKKRNLAAKQSQDQKAGPMKDRREGRGGAKNEMREILEKDPSNL